MNLPYLGAVQAEMRNDRRDSAQGDEMRLPFNQSELGDLIGLTNVSVSKYMTQLSTEGFIERKGQRIVLRRRAELQRMIGYEPLGFPSDILLHDTPPANWADSSRQHSCIKPAAVSRSVPLMKMDEQDGWDGN